MKWCMHSTTAFHLKVFELKVLEPKVFETKGICEPKVFKTKGIYEPKVFKTKGIWVPKVFKTYFRIISQYSNKQRHKAHTSRGSFSSASYIGCSWFNLREGNRGWCSEWQCHAVISLHVKVLGSKAALETRQINIVYEPTFVYEPTIPPQSPI